MCYLYLLNGQVQKRELVADRDNRLGSFAAHAGAETAVQLEHNQLVEHVTNGILRRLLRKSIVWLYLQ